MKTSSKGVLNCIYFYLFSVHMAVCDKCLNLNFSIIQKVDHEGFHRNIQWLIETQNLDEKLWLESHCNLVLQVYMSSGMFVNPDQLAELNRTRELTVAIDGTVDVELAAHEAQPHTVYLFLNSSNIDNVSLSLPIHLRYQRSQITGSYGKVSLMKPSLLAYCSDGVDKICHIRNKVEAPCNVTTTTKCSWRNISYNAHFEDVEFYVPIGDLDDYPLVSIVSLLLGCSGCIYILSLLSTKSL